MDSEHFISARACVANGRRLLEDAEMLEFSNPPSTSFAIATIAQEEFAKGFFMVLIARGVIAWSPLMYRASRDHTCKQLLGIVMEYVNPDSHVFLKLMEERQAKTQKAFELLDTLRRTDSSDQKREIWKQLADIKKSREGFPATVADAMNILRHEKIGRWQSRFAWDEEPQYDPLAKMTGKGSMDREKQDALYIRLSRSGGVIGSPLSVRFDTAKDAIGRAERLCRLVEQLVEGNTGGLVDYEEIESALKTLFADLSEQGGLKVEGE
jgi:AbiV family abortive infection protein